MSEYEKLKTNLRKTQYVWLISGVAGFIGSNLLEHLLCLNQKVIGLDNFSTGYQHNLDQAVSDAECLSKKDLKSNFKFIHGDIRDLEACRNACHGVDFVLHQAALASVPRSIDDPLGTHASNVDGFQNMLVACNEMGVKKVVYASSSSVYGDDQTLPKLEDKIGRPLSPYAASKLANEIYSDVFSRIYEMNIIGLRYFNIFGKRQDPKGAYAAVIPKWTASIMEGKAVEIYGDGKTSRDFCYIENVVQMNLLAALVQEDNANNQIYNVAVGDRIDLNELYETIVENLIEKQHLSSVRKPIYRNFRAGDVRHSLADTGKSRDLLGYEPMIKVKEGIAKTINWHVGNSPVS